MSTKDNRHTKQDDRDEVKQYKQRKHKYLEDEDLDDAEDQLSDEAYDFILRHMR